jgi:hypothetical protein
MAVRQHPAGALVLTDGPISFGQVSLKNRGIWTKDNRTSHQLDRALIVPLLVTQNAKHVQCVGVPGLLGQHLLIQTGRFHQLTALMRGHGGPQNFVHAVKNPETSWALQSCTSNQHQRIAGTFPPCCANVRSHKGDAPS